MIRKEYITDVIGEDYKNWMPGEHILIDAQTGSGKSFFILHNLIDYCRETKKQILYVCNRTFLKNQLINLALKNPDNPVKILTYQKLEKDIYYKSEDYQYNMLFSYDFIVFDESHYFCNDSVISVNTDLVFEEIPYIDEAVLIFMTGTPQVLNQYFEQKQIKIDRTYNVKKDYSYIKKILFFNDEDVVKDILKTIPLDEKAIYFSSKLKRAYEYRKDIEDTCFICSENNANYKDYIDQDELDRIIEEEYFKPHILITTSCLDNGVSIVDNEVKHIIIDIPDLITLIQCVGRLRINNKSDKITLYIRQPLGNSLNSPIQEAKKNLKIAEDRLKFPKELFEQYYNKEETFGILDTDLDINYAVKVKSEWDLQFYQSCIEDKQFYINTIKRYFQQSTKKTEYFIKNKDCVTLRSFLNKSMNSEQIKEFREYMSKNYLVTNKKKYRTNGFNVINGFFLDNKFPYTLIIKKIKNKTYWILQSNYKNTVSKHEKSS